MGRGHSAICSCTPQILAIFRSVPCLHCDLGTLSVPPTQVTGSQLLGPSSTTSHGVPQQETEPEAKAGLNPRSLIIECGYPKWQLAPLCPNTLPLLHLFLCTYTSQSFFMQYHTHYTGEATGKLELLIQHHTVKKWQNWNPHSCWSDFRSHFFSYTFLTGQ